jgi:hypothetical protein
MRYKSPEGPRRRHTTLSKVGMVLTRLQPYFVQTVNQSSVYSPDQRKKMVNRYRQIVEETLDGVSREKGIVTVQEGVDLSLFRHDDIKLQVKLEGLEDEVQYFVSLGLNIIEKLYLTNRMSEDLYFKYRRLLRFIPKFHGDLIGLWEKSRKS